MYNFIYIFRTKREANDNQTETKREPNRKQTRTKLQLWFRFGSLARAPARSTVG